MLGKGGRCSTLSYSVQYSRYAVVGVFSVGRVFQRGKPFVAAFEREVFCSALVFLCVSHVMLHGIVLCYQFPSLVLMRQLQVLEVRFRYSSTTELVL